MAQLAAGRMDTYRDQLHVKGVIVTEFDPM
jgi:hypothetical protein